MSEVLVEFNENWADEFDVHGLAIMKPEQFNRLIKWAENCNWNFGSNEGWEDDDISDGFKVISEEPTVIDIIQKTLKFSQYGTFRTWGNFPDPDELYDPDFD